MVLLRRAKFFGPLFVVLGILLFFTGLTAVKLTKRVESEGKEVTGKVYQKGILRSTKTKTYQAVVDYPVSEVKLEYRQKFTFSKSEFDQLTDGAPISVKYLPDAPRSAVAGETGKGLGAASSEELVIAFVPIIIGLFLIWWAFFRKPKLKIESEPLVEKTDGDPTDFDESKYPQDVQLNLKKSDRLSFQIQLDKSVLEELEHVSFDSKNLPDKFIADVDLSIDREPYEPEDEHILCFDFVLPDGSRAKSRISAGEFYGGFTDREKRKFFLSDLDSTEIQHLENTHGFGPFVTMDDSREYFKIRINGQQIQLRSKYLGMEFVLIPNDTPTTSFSILVSMITDAEANDVPTFKYDFEAFKHLFNNGMYYPENEENVDAPRPVIFS